MINHKKIFLGELNREVTVDEAIELSAIPPGWRSLIYSLFITLFDHGWDGKLFQMKEKFGGLRFYLDGERTEDIAKAIETAEDVSEKICCVCGNEATTTTKGWYTHTAVMNMRKQRYSNNG